ncbi:MAG: class I SAM-dependent methyltransferase [Rhodospirillales bacterium]|nr:class I SAM-dependent methyltransferase [Rhodospirillales bacterium]
MKNNGSQQPAGSADPGTAALQDILRRDVKVLGYHLAQQLAQKLPLVPVEGMPTRVPLKSKACTQDDVESAWFGYWCNQIKAAPVYHRKLWEFCYILQALFDAGMLREGASGLGFGCGEEPLPSLFASMGISVMATDAPADASGWTTSREYTQTRESLFKPYLCDRNKFDRLVSFSRVDMRNIPSNLAGRFDFVWSSCALEHLGSITEGLRFIEKSAKCLTSGGVAVHTTEWNFSSDESTLEDFMTVLFLRKHFEDVAEQLTNQGYLVAPLDFSIGSGLLDQFIDLPPYADPMHAHLRLMLGQYATTSFGMIITKPLDQA